MGYKLVKFNIIHSPKGEFVVVGFRKHTETYLNGILEITIGQNGVVTDDKLIQ